MSPVRHQAITWTNAGLLSIDPLETIFSEIPIKIQNFSFTKMPLKISSAKWRPFCTGAGGVKMLLDPGFWSTWRAVEHWQWRKLIMRTLQWRHNEHDGVSNHRRHDCLLNRLFRHRSKKTSKLRVTRHCEGDSMVTGELPAQRASNAENIPIWWRHHEFEACHPGGISGTSAPAPYHLTQLPLDIMAAISQTMFLDAFSWMKSVSILIKISLKFVSKGLINNNTALAKIMAWRRIDKPLSEPMLTQFTDTYMRR